MVYALITFAILFILWIFIIIASFAVFYKIFYSSKAKPPPIDSTRINKRFSQELIHRYKEKKNLPRDGKQVFGVLMDE